MIMTKPMAQIASKADFDRVLFGNSALKEKLLKEGTGDYTISSAYTDQAVGLNYVYLQQAYQGINVYNSIQTAVFKDNKLQYNSGKFVANIAAKAGTATPVILASKAINLAAAHLGVNDAKNLTEVTNSFATEKKIVFSDGGIAQENITTELMWVPINDGKSVELAWNVTIAPIGSSDYWHVRVNAISGKIIEKGNYTVHERMDEQELAEKRYWVSKNSPEHKAVTFANLNLSNQLTSRLKAKAPINSTATASYSVVPFPAENPFIGGVATDIDPWTKAGVGNNATTFGWHFDSLVNYKITRGNNVYAYDDSLAKNNPGRPDTSSTNAPVLTFDYTPDFNQQPTLTVNRKFAVSNLFYWNNIMHDLTYQYGFTEPAGNFQNNNNARGGIKGDNVRAEAQDGGGTDNANFSALPDGQTARMQMYLFNSIFKNGKLVVSTPPTIAGDYNYIESGFSTANTLAAKGSVTGTFALYNDDNTGVNHRACTGAPVNSVAGKIAVIFRGACNFVVKVKNAQIAGAKAVIMIDTLVGANPIIMGGTDNTITIPAVMISAADGALLEAELSSGATVTGTIEVPAKPKFDGDLDNSIVSHEYVHGVSNRLTGGPATTSCLNNAEQGGEGWSDYVALMVTTDWTKMKLTDDTIQRAIGAYAISQRPNSLIGVRKFPYTTDMSINTRTYADLAASSEVHDIGEVWCAALWDMTWGIIQQEGVINPNIFDANGIGGNSVAFKLVMQGMKLQPCKPGFLDARDAILAADSILYGGSHRCTIWTAFARRGMGYDAEQGSSLVCGDELEGYQEPTCTLPLNLLDFTAAAQGTSAVALKWLTSAEINSKDFTIEHSNTNNAWKAIGTQLAKNGTTTNAYAFVHKEPVTGVNYYRLKMNDKDGSFKYSKVLAVNVNRKQGISIYPNPVTEKLIAEVFKTDAESVTVSVVDLAGRILFEQVNNVKAGLNKIEVNTSTLAKGTYLLQITGKDKTVKEFVKH